MNQSADGKSDKHPHSPAGQPRTRELIRRAAEELYVLRGHDGFSFGDIATALNITRANIHHHFGNKRRLMAELVEGFTADAETRISHHWARPGIGFQARLEFQCEDLRRFYTRFNPEPGTRNVWSPLSRLRLDLPVLGHVGTAALERVNRAYDTHLRTAVAAAISAGELSAKTRSADVVRLLRITFLSCGPVTQDTGNFAEVECLFDALAQTLAAAWGRRKSG